MRVVCVVACLLTLACLERSAVAAEDQEPPCTRDVVRWCNNVPPVGAFVQTCLEQNSSSLSKACRDRLGDFTREATRLSADCASDLSRLCAPVQDAAGLRVACLVQNRDGLSPTCRATLDDLSKPKTK